MKVCFFGAYYCKYGFNPLIRGLERNNVEIVDCFVAPSKFIPYSFRQLFFFFIATLVRYIKLCVKHSHIKDYDVMIVAWPAFYDVLLGKILSKLRRKSLVYYAFLSHYNTQIFDREYEKKSFKIALKAKLFYLYDRIPCKLADLILLDTQVHIDYFVKTFRLPQEKFRRLFVGASSNVFQPQESQKANKFMVIFFGRFIPLHGIKYIIQAADLLKNYRNIKFRIVGKGQTKKENLRLAKKLRLTNIDFVDYLSPEELAIVTAKADIGLGIFGETNKAKKVIPHKIFDLMAMKKSIITGDSPAVREILTDKKNVILCKMANTKSLAESILLLKNNRQLREKISVNAYNLFKKKFTRKKIGEELKDILEELTT